MTGAIEGPLPGLSGRPTFRANGSSRCIMPGLPNTRHPFEPVTVAFGAQTLTPWLYSIRRNELFSVITLAYIAEIRNACIQTRSSVSHERK